MFHLSKKTNRFFYLSFNIILLISLLFPAGSTVSAAALMPPKESAPVSAQIDETQEVTEAPAETPVPTQEVTATGEPAAATETEVTETQPAATEVTETAIPDTATPVPPTNTPVQYTLNVTLSGDGSVVFDPPGGVYTAGTTVTITASAAANYAFNTWSGDVNGTENPLIVNMDGNKSITATFTKKVLKLLEANTESTCSGTLANIVASADAYMNSGNTKGAYNYGGATTRQMNPYYKSGSTTNEQFRGALIKWDLSSIPAGATITAASMSYYVTDAATTYAYSLYQLRRAWVEGTNDGTAGTGASWNYYGAGTGSWAATGAQDTSSDRYDINLWDANTSTFAATGNVTIDLNSSGVAVIQSWLNNSAGNYGITIQNYSGTAADNLAFASRENTSYTKPTLNVCYNTNPTISTSGSLSAFSAPPGTASAPQTYTVSASYLSDNLTINAPNGFQISSDGSTYSSSLTLAPSGGTINVTTIYVKLFNAVEGSFSGSITHTSSGAVEKDMPVSGTVAPYYNLTVNAPNGAVAFSPAGGSYISGTVVTLTATANNGYVFNGWSGDISGSSNPTTITMTGNKTVNASFVAANCNTVNKEAIDDTYLSGANTSNNYGITTTLKITNNNNGTKRGSLWKWDVSDIPVGATISSASISIYVSTSSTQTYNLYNMRRAWLEGTENSASTKKDGASWLTYNGTNTWGTEGATNITTDRYDTNLWEAGTSSFSSAVSSTVNLNAAGIAAVQSWVNNPAVNYGVTAQNYSSTTGSDDLQYASSENTSNSGPTLNITYCVASNTPTITVSGTLNTFTGAAGAYSNEQSYNVSGTKLSDNLIISSSSANFEISTASGGSFGPSITLTPTDGTIASTSIYVRFKGASVGSYNATITHTSSGAAEKDVALSGTVANSAPTLSLLQPTSGSSGASTSPTLAVKANDADVTDTINVSFYGRSASSTSAANFMLVLFPDIQNEAQYNKEMLNAQANWVVNKKTDNNIVFVTTTGDTVNTSSSSTEYGNADAAFDVLDAGGVWYTVSTGNHDVAMGSSLFANYFGPSRYASHLYSNGYWFGGSYDDYNFYSLFSAGGMDFILINLQYSPSDAAINWADNLLSTYSNRRAIVEQHDMLNVDNSWNNQASYNALRDHNNLFLMLCGHMHAGNDGAAYVAGSGTDGHTIHVVEADYQDFSNGNGYLRLFDFSPANDQILMTTYSPYQSVGSITTDPDQKTLAYDMDASGAYTLIRTVQITPGATASITWGGLLNNTQYQWYAVADDGTNTTTSSTWDFTTQQSTSTPPTVSINQASSQSDPTSVFPINFTVEFSEAVNDFDSSDVNLGGTAPGTKSVSVSGSGATYNVAVSGMIGSGTVTASIAAGVAHNANGDPNQASTSSDNQVTYAVDTQSPTVTINQASTQSDPTNTSPIKFTVVFSESVNDFDGSDVTLGGTAPGAKSVDVSGSGATSLALVA
ncbi:MAG: DNRLRE domain-containing protein [Anaerolineae bacterium]|nr:DNRLRE domain-containing protein [Anaerolineae bacterium]